MPRLVNTGLYAAPSSLVFLVSMVTTILTIHHIYNKMYKNPLGNVEVNQRNSYTSTVRIVTMNSVSVVFRCLQFIGMGLQRHYIEVYLVFSVFTPTCLSTANPAIYIGFTKGVIRRGRRATNSSARSTGNLSSIKVSSDTAKL